MLTRKTEGYFHSVRIQTYFVHGGQETIRIVVGLVSIVLKKL